MWLDLGEYRGPSHCHALVRFMVARSNERAERSAFRSYVCDSLQYAPQGKYIVRRYADAIRPRHDFDANEVVDRIVELVEAS